MLAAAVSVQRPVELGTSSPSDETKACDVPFWTLLSKVVADEFDAYLNSVPESSSTSSHDPHPETSPTPLRGVMQTMESDTRRA